MIRKKVKVSFDLNDLSRYYLEKLEFIDGRTGNKKKNKSKSIGSFINECIISTVERNAEKKNYTISIKDLEIGYINHERTIKSREVKRLCKEIAKLDELEEEIKGDED